MKLIKREGGKKKEEMVTRRHRRLTPLGSTVTKIPFLLFEKS